MRYKQQTQMMPDKRTDKTYRVVLQHFEPATGPHGRYRDIASIRLESESFETSEKLTRKFKTALADLIGTGKI